MRLTDEPGTSSSVTVAAAPELVWEHLSDLDLHAASSDELQAVEWLDGAEGPASGARFTGSNRRGDVDWETTSTVTDCEPPSALAWVVGDPDRPTATWRYTISPREEARGAATDVRGEVRLGPGHSRLSEVVSQEPEREEEFVDARLETLRRAIDATLAALDQRLEGLRHA